MMSIARLVILSGVLLGVFAFAAYADGQPADENENEPENELLHSDLPLFGHGDENEWPQHFVTEDSFGCTSRVAFGDWALRRLDAQDDDDIFWYRFENYGAFHCFANISRAYDRAALAGADVHHSFFVLLDTRSVNGRDVELWAIQIGARPGSEYLLLSREAGDGLVEKFDVLQTACPSANVRDAGALDILITRYCSVRSSAELVDLAHRMMARPPLGTLTRVSDENDAPEGKK